MDLHNREIETLASPNIAAGKNEKMRTNLMANI